MKNVFLAAVCAMSFFGAPMEGDSDPMTDNNNRTADLMQKGCESKRARTVNSESVNELMDTNQEVTVHLFGIMFLDPLRLVVASDIDCGSLKSTLIQTAKSEPALFLNRPLDIIHNKSLKRLPEDGLLSDFMQECGVTTDGVLELTIIIMSRILEGIHIIDRMRRFNDA